MNNEVKQVRGNHFLNGNRNGHAYEAKQKPKNTQPHTNTDK